MGGLGGDHEALLEGVPGAIVVISPGGRIVRVNAQAERLFGYDRTEIVDEPVELLIPEGLPVVDLGHASSGVDDPGRIGARLKRSGRKKGGSAFSAEISLSSVETRDGPIVVVTVRDVTDRLHAETMFRGLLEAAPDAIVAVNAEGLIVLVNSRAEQLFGYQRDEIVGQSIEQLVPDSARACHPRHRSLYVVDARPRAMGSGLELAARRKDGSEFPAEISLSAIETGDGLLVSAAVRDTTERVEAEVERARLRDEVQQERLANRLRQFERSESLGQLVSGVAHDFNNLLGVILNYSTFILDEVDQLPGDIPITEVIRNDAKQILRAAGSGADLTKQLLAFDRDELIAPQVVDLNRLVTVIEQFLARTIGANIELEISLAQDLWPILADQGQLEQVLVNLAVNARDAMPQGGKLTIETANVQVDANHAAVQDGVALGRYVQLKVGDNGVGMEPGTLEQVFVRTFTTKPKGHGSGLGLATVHRIVTQAGGYCFMHSNIDVGSTFAALFPATSEISPGEQSAST